MSIESSDNEAAGAHSIGYSLESVLKSIWSVIASLSPGSGWSDLSAPQALLALEELKMPKAKGSTKRNDFEDPDTKPANEAPSLKRKRSSSSTESRAKRGRAKGFLKSLISLEPYDADIAENAQLEDYWGENLPVGAASAPETEEEKLAREKLEREMAAKEAELDAKLPEKYRKFRPRGYLFNLPPTDRPVRIYADGVFDLFHLGHMKQLEQAKKSLPNVHMIVGVPSDKLTHKYKGLTVLSDKQRRESLTHCRWVDEVVANAPWSVDQEFLDKHEIDYVAHDDIPYQSAGADDVYKFVKEQGRFLTTQRTEGVSTSDIITKIIRDYDLYLMRNFARGVSRKELNVSWFKKNELDMKRHVGAFRQSFMANVEHTRDFYADAMGVMQSVLRSGVSPEHFETAYQGGSGAQPPRNGFLGKFRDWIDQRIDGSTPADTSASEAESPAPAETTPLN